MSALGNEIGGLPYTVVLDPSGQVLMRHQGEWRREDAAAGTNASLIICDTDALTTMLWSDLLYGTSPDELRRGAEKRCRNYALYLLCDIDVPFTPDRVKAALEGADAVAGCRRPRRESETRHDHRQARSTRHRPLASR